MVPNLKPSELELIAALGEGRPTRFMGAKPDVHVNNGWADRTVRAEVILDLCLGDSYPAHGTGLYLKDAYISGQLDFRWRKLRCPVRIEGCHVASQLRVADAEIPCLALDGSFFPQGIAAARLKTTFLHLNRTEVHGELDLSDANIDGNLIATGALLKHPSGNALAAKHLTVGGDAMFDGGLVATGVIHLDRATIAGRLDFGGAQLSAPGRVVLRVDNATIGGDAAFGAATDAEGRPTYDKDGQPIRFYATGEVSIIAAKIGGGLDCSGGKYDNPGGTALSADRIDVGGTITMSVATDSDGEAIPDTAGNPLAFEARGEVRLLSATIKGQLDCSGALIKGRLNRKGENADPAEDRDALSADGIHVGQPVFLSVPTNGAGDALRNAAGQVLRFQSEGMVRFPDATLDQMLDCGGARFSNHGLTALYLDGITVARDVLLSSIDDPAAKDPDADSTISCHIDGKIRLRTAAIGGSLVCSGAELAGADDDGLVFDAANAKIVAALRWKCLTLQGNVSLKGASVGVLEDDQDSWGLPKNHWTLDRFAYSGISTDDQAWSWKARNKWIECQPVYSSTPYQQLAKVYREAGADKSARKILLEQFRAQIRREDGGLRWWEKWWHTFLDVTIGHGYAPWRVLYVGAALWAAGTGVFMLAQDHNRMAPTKSPVTVAASQGATGQPGAAPAATSRPGHPPDCAQLDVPCLVPPVYALDELLPVVNLGQRDNWHPVGPLGYRAMSWLLVLSGWLLTTLVVAGFTSIVRRS